MYVLEQDTNHWRPARWNDPADLADLAEQDLESGPPLDPVVLRAHLAAIGFLDPEPIRAARVARWKALGLFDLPPAERPAAVERWKALGLVP